MFGLSIAGVSALCATIGGTVMTGIITFTEGLETALTVGKVLSAVITLITSVAELLLNKPKDELPEELGVKAELCHEREGLKPDDFDSVEDYIEHLRKEVQIPPERAVENMNEEERSKYEMVGIGLYTKDMEQRFGIGLEPEFWKAAYQISATAEDIQTLVTAMKASGLVHGRDIDAYLSGRLEPGNELLMQVANALKSLGQTLGELQDAYRQKADE